MTTDGLSPGDKELWRRVATDDVARGAVSDLDFAAWLEGRLPAVEASRVEAAVAADPELRRAALDLAEVLGLPLPAAPERLAVRARALVGFEAERRSARTGLFDWLLARDRRFAVQRALALGCAVVVAGTGFMMGGGLGASLAQERYASAASSAARSGSASQAWNAAFELTELPTAEGI